MNAEELGQEFAENPFLFAGYRGLFANENDETVPEENTLPFLRTVLFLPAIFGYLIYQKVMVSLTSDATSPSQYDHIISITSTSEYRSYTLVEVAKELKAKGEDVLFLCSPSGEGRIDEWREITETVRHKQLHGTISLRTLVNIPLKSFRDTYRLRTALSTEDIDRRTFVFVFNLIILEYVKYHSIEPVTFGEPKIHTLKPMPYFLESTSRESIYVYQHGTQVAYPEQAWPGIEDGQRDIDLKASVPYYVPLAYFVWGDAWKENFKRLAHPDSTVVVTGSPWYDSLSSMNQQGSSKNIDVLFISQSHAVLKSKLTKYEKMVETLIEICAEHDLEFAVKLHPREGIEWYEDRGIASYVRQFDDIDTALLQSRVAVTDTSTAFIEANVFGTPSVVVDVSERGLRDIGPVNHVYFPRSLDRLEGNLLNALDSRPIDTGNQKEVVRVGDSISRLIQCID
ncbi:MULTISPECIES: hypothetical protein [unclassified Haloferax]|uniref:hypothetical protein n=1 Tax=unclassified Haloferax TaxID=2625095 RepID=UPI002876B496|nr:MULTISPECIES: hypothetical protein [unclassified Haloferax]MDS0239883.1 hypothetical protein [Haloferax sp. S2CR25]MDS0443004.1 hypothetical protein [Haloferax sp. S2CR25-2]